MIQRKQHLYLLLISFTASCFFLMSLSAGENLENQKEFLMSLFNFSWRAGQGAWAIAEEYNILFAFLLPVIILPIVTILRFKKLKQQMFLILVNYLVIVGFIYVYVKTLLEIINDQDFSINDLDMMSILKLFMMFLWIILNFLASKGIQADENLLKSADRIR